MTATSKPPRLTLRLPGAWLHLDPARPEISRARIRAFVETSIGRADQLATARADLRKGLGDMLSRADGPAAHQSTFLCHEVAPGVAAPIAVSVFAPADVRMSPVVGTSPEAVIAGFLDAMEDIAGAREWSRLACADGWAARRWRVTTAQVAPELADQAVSTFTAEYWRTVPATKRLMLVTVTSPLAVIPQTMLRLADAIVAGSRIAADEHPHPHATE
ncbi:hypothetical protein [Demequina sp.]|uniref:hypothetical protein n=1 Tax=Demequina sp. TaxID=2050685 RepID=UPI0025BA62F0|nr:hypothetical protein [Demequina sp.]